MAPTTSLKNGPETQVGSENLFSTSSESSQNEENEAPRPRRKKWRDAGLIFPSNRLYMKLKAGKYAKRIQKEAAVAITGILEYLVFELLDMAREVATINQKKRISPRYLMIAIERDEEFAKLMQGVTIPRSGVFPHIEDFLLPKISAGRKRPSESTRSSGVQAKKKKQMHPAEPETSDSE